MSLALLAAAVLLASGDNLGIKKDCAEYVAHYQALMEDRADLDVTEAPGGRGAPHPLVRVERSRDRADDALDRVEEDVARSCRVANRSQYECVVQAERYEDLRSCGLAALPVLEAAERHAAPPGPPPTTPEERARANEAFARTWVRSGVADLEALGTGSGAPQAEERAAPESDVVKSGL